MQGNMVELKDESLKYQSMLNESRLKQNVEVLKKVVK
jgi:hypothetical protein